MEWEVKISGDMTIVIIEGKRIVARVDMLRQKTLNPGDNGDRLCKTINDLTAITKAVNNTKIVLPHECGLSPLPWQATWSKNCFFIKDCTGKLICSRSISVNNLAFAKSDFQAISEAIKHICCSYYKIKEAAP